MPTGSEFGGNVDQWIKSGCVAVGSEVNSPPQQKQVITRKSTELARRFIERIEDARRAR